MEREIRRRTPPPVSLADLLNALRDVMTRAELFGHHHIQRESLSVRERMSQVLERLDALRFTSLQRAVPHRRRGGWGWW